MIKALKYILPSRIRLALRKLIIKNKYPGVLLGKNTIVTGETVFEGNSLVASYSEVAGSKIGFGSYIANGTKLNRTLIGRFCSIGENVCVVAGTHPTNRFVSTHPAFFSSAKEAGFSFVKENLFGVKSWADKSKKFYLEIGNDVWIGSYVLIKSGIKIGNGSVIGFGSAVTKDIEPYSINAGVPCIKIGSRFEEDQIKFIEKSKWWDYDFEWLKENAGLFTDINVFIKKLGKNRS